MTIPAGTKTDLDSNRAGARGANSGRPGLVIFDGPEYEGGIDIPADEWRWKVANWPFWRWKKWHDLSWKLTPKDATAGQIVDAQQRAFVRFMDGDDAIEFEPTEDFVP